MYFIVVHNRSEAYCFITRWSAEQKVNYLMDSEGASKENIKVYYGEQLQLQYDVHIVEEKKEF